MANPAGVLAGILAQLKDPQGRITIPGFYDKVRVATAAERAELARLPFDETRYREAIGVPELFGESGFTTLERAWIRPTLEVNGLLSGFTGQGIKTVIPAVAMAKLSTRLVPDQDPAEICDLLEAYLQQITPKYVDLKLTRLQSGKPWITPTEHPYIQAAARAMERAFHAPSLFTLEGGSNAIVTLFEEVLRAPIILFSLGLPTDQAHAPNESLELYNFQNGIVAAASV